MGKVSGTLVAIWVSAGLLISMIAIIPLAVDDLQSTCRTNDKGQNYCRYKGQIPRIYVNQEGLVLVYFEATFDKKSAAEKGYEIGNGSAGALLTVGTPASEEMLNMIRLAYTEGRDVEIHMRDVHSGYLLIDRVWMN